MTPEELNLELERRHKEDEHIRAKLANIEFYLNRLRKEVDSNDYNSTVRMVLLALLITILFFHFR